LLNKFVILLVSGKTDENAGHNKQNAYKCQQKVVVWTKGGRKKRNVMAAYAFHSKELSDVINAVIAFALKSKINNNQCKGDAENPPPCLFKLAWQ
jgi:hypothetical protein